VVQNYSDFWPKINMIKGNYYVKEKIKNVWMILDIEN
jgi:hypothetical protein